MRNMRNQGIQTAPRPKENAPVNVWESNSKKSKEDIMFFQLEHGSQMVPGTCYYCIYLHEIMRYYAISYDALCWWTLRHTHMCIYIYTYMITCVCMQTACMYFYDCIIYMHSLLYTHGREADRGQSIDVKLVALLIRGLIAPNEIRTREPKSWNQNPKRRWSKLQ